MKSRLMYSAPLMALLLVSVVSAVAIGSYSLRGSNGDIEYINGVTDFKYERAKFSAYVSPGSRGTGQGSVILQAKTNDGERLRLGVKLTNANVLRDDNILKVESDGYYYQRYRSWNGFWRTQKVEGTVTYTFNKNTGETVVVGTNGLNFKVSGLNTINLR